TKSWAYPSFIEQSASYELGPSTLFKLVLIFFGLAMLRFCIPSGFSPSVMLWGLKASRWSSPWATGNFSQWDTFLDQLTYFGYLIPALAVLLARRTKLFDIRVAIAVLFALVFMAFMMQSGSRRIIGVTLGAAIVCWMIEQKRFLLHHVIGLTLSTVG